MSEHATRIEVPAELISEMIARAVNDDAPAAPTAQWPSAKGLHVMPSRPVPYGHHRLEGVIATSGADDDPRQVLVVLYAAEHRPAHRTLHYQAGSRTASRGSRAEGPVSAAQMDSDGRLVGEILHLLAHGDGEMQEQTPEHAILYNGQAPPFRWRPNGEAAV